MLVRSDSNGHRTNTRWVSHRYAWIPARWPGHAPLKAALLEWHRAGLPALHWLTLAAGEGAALPSTHARLLPARLAAGQSRGWQHRLTVNREGMAKHWGLLAGMQCLGVLKGAGRGGEQRMEKKKVPHQKLHIAWQTLDLFARCLLLIWKTPWAWGAGAWALAAVGDDPFWGWGKSQREHRQISKTKQPWAEPTPIQKQQNTNGQGNNPAVNAWQSLNGTLKSC